MDVTWTTLSSLHEMMPNAIFRDPTGSNYPFMWRSGRKGRLLAYLSLHYMIRKGHLNHHTWRKSLLLSSNEFASGKCCRHTPAENYIDHCGLEKSNYIDHYIEHTVLISILQSAWKARVGALGGHGAVRIEREHLGFGFKIKSDSNANLPNSQSPMDRCFRKSKRVRND